MYTMYIFMADSIHYTSYWLHSKITDLPDADTSWSISTRSTVNLAITGTGTIKHKKYRESGDHRHWNNQTQEVP